MARRVLDVFLSSTAFDLTPHRQSVYDRLKRSGVFHCTRQEDFGPQNAGAVEHCRQMVQAAEMFVGLVGLRRGWEPDGDNACRSITEMEHDWARDAGSRRYIWVAPDDFAVPANLRESDEQYGRQVDFRRRVMAGGERIVSQSGFGSADLLASEIVEHLMVQVVTGDLITLLRPDLKVNAAAAEEQAPTIAAAVERLSSDKDIDLQDLAANPGQIEVGALQAKLSSRAQAHEAAAAPKLRDGIAELKASADYYRHAGALAFLHDTGASIAAFEKAVSIDPDAPEGWRFLGELRYRLGDLSEAQAAFERVRDLGDRAKDLKASSMGRLRLGWLQWERGNLTGAEKLHEEALRLASDAAWLEGMSRAYSNLGIVNYTRGELAKAVELQERALELERIAGTRPGLARAQINLGVSHLALGNFDRADELQRNALALSSALNDKESMARIYTNLGIIEQKRGDLDKAETCQREALALYEAVGSKIGRASVCVNLGSIAQQQKDLARAEQLYQAALALNREIGRPEAVAATLGNLGIVYSDLGDEARMRECWRAARDQYRQIGLEAKAAEWDHWLAVRSGNGT